MSKIKYTSHLITTNDDKLTSLLAKKYTDLRIKGLQQSPQSFSATLESEKSLTEQEQIDRILVDRKWIVVIVAEDDDDHQSKPWFENEWVAQATLLGPNKWQDHIIPFKNSHRIEDRLTDEQLLSTTQYSANQLDNVSFWHMTALYVDINHRKKGLANQLCRYAFEVIGTKSLDHSAEIRIIIKPSNSIVIKMYENLEFKKQEQNSSLSEACFAAGDRAILPKDYQDQLLYTKRTGIIMTKMIKSSDKK